ncbi:MAG: histone deacetylase family protein [Elusimicrobiota bacterium]|nr:histone deacetylase family protein [Elusimicrobiota bacterium]
MKIVTTKKCWEYEDPGHPESPERVKRTYEYLRKLSRQVSGSSEIQLEFVDVASAATEEDILRVHSPRLLNEVREEKFYEPDTPAIKGIFQFAMLSAGAAIESAEIATKGDVAFSLMRPPGHHAMYDQLGGFCYFNNIAIAVKYLIAKSSNHLIAILDIDCHHGNGTQDIFRDCDKVLFVSLHQVPLYPGTGLKSEKNCLNFPLPPGTDEKKYLTTLERALKEIDNFKPQTIAISAGFDTYKGDPITQMNLEKITYRKIGEMITSLNLPHFAVLEGGYSPDLPECIYNFLVGFSHSA